MNTNNTTPAQRPILFSTPMVQAILAGRKTETRRVVKPMPPATYLGLGINVTKNIVGHYWSNGLAQRFWPAAGKPLQCPYGLPGTVLWVRESFCKIGNTNLYKADDKKVMPASAVKWKPSIHMPKAAARIWLQVSEIKVERLQDITDEGAILEGCLVEQEIFVQGELRGAFINVWSSINGYISWALNPYVWVVKFKVLSTTGKPQNL